MGTIIVLAIGVGLGVFLGLEAYDVGFSWRASALLGWVVLISVSSAPYGHRHKGGD
jgi:hypothetical protein